MAKIDLNPALAGVRGKMDGWVYRQQNGQTVAVSYRPATGDEPSLAQQGGRERFRAAQAYASRILADPLQRALYRKLGAEQKRPPNAVLISNFLTPPTIDQVELGGYAGGAGHVIRIVATDPIEVITVTLRIHGADNTMSEAGPAVKDHGIWNYRTTVILPPDTPWRIEVVAGNRAGAEAMKSITSSIGSINR